MSILKSENNPTEKYTIESFLSAVIAVAGLICFPVTIFLPCFGPIPWFFSLVLGLISWRGIKIKGGSKWTRILTIIGVVVSILGFLVSLPWQLFAAFWVWTCMQNPGHPC